MRELGADGGKDAPVLGGAAEGGQPPEEHRGLGTRDSGDGSRMLPAAADC